MFRMSSVLQLGIFLSLLVLFSACQTIQVKKEVEDLDITVAHLPLEQWNRPADCCTATGKKMAIASGGPNSSKAGIEIVEEGGNIIDAAVAVAFALSVERPQSCGVGGGGFMTLHLAKEKNKDQFIDFRETAPRKSTRDMYLDKQGNVIPRLSLDGALSVGTPGFVLGMYEIHKKWGKLSWKKVLQPAIRLAGEGFPVDPTLEGAIERRKEILLKDWYTKNLLFDDKGEGLKRGVLFIQKDFAKTLKQIAEKGPSVFYEGPIAKKISNFIMSRKGILDAKDLKAYKVRYRQPVRGKFKSFTFTSAPPPSAGGVLFVQMLKVLEPFKLKELARNPSEYLHLLAEVMARGYVDRSRYIGDTDFVKTNYKKLMEEAYADKIRKSLNLAMHTPASKLKPGDYLPREKPNTTHLSLIDDQGNAISSTLTINYTFGSGLAVPGTGIFLNDEMDDFSAKVGEKNIYGLTGEAANAIAPLKRPVSSMTPTIVFQDGKPVMALGGAGGSRIISNVFQVMVNDLILYPWDLHRAMFAPRMHYQWIPDKMYLEKDGFEEAVKKALQRKGHTLEKNPFFARVEAVQRNPNNDELTAVFDPRTTGGAEAL